MTTIKPFCAVRPRAEAAPFIAALPYDVQSTSEARQIVANNPRSFLAIDEPVVNFPTGTDPYDLPVYLKAGELYRELRDSADCVKDDEPSYYLYELTMEGQVQNGFVACVSIDDYLNGIVKEHESTRVNKEMDRVNHIRGCEAQTGPIFLTFHSDDELAALLSDIKATEPLFDFEAEDGIRHRGFRVPASMNETITKRFDQLGRVYIADGHHRIAAASEVAKARRLARESNEPTEESDYVLAVLFADSELRILPYNRVVHNLNGLSPEDFLDELQSRFDVEKLVDPHTTAPLRMSSATTEDERASMTEALTPQRKGMFSALVDGIWYRCVIREEDTSTDAYENLDVSILQRRLFEPVLGIADPRRSPRIDFVGGIRGIEELEYRCETDCAAAFALYPTSIDELFAVADAGLLMPPKSTWFEPKLRSGLFIHEI